jgi:LytS/YehU family sensor histidine kinase
LVRTDFEQESITEILTDTSYLFAIYFTSTYVYAFVMMLIKTVKTRFEERHKIQLLQKEKATNELKFLKGQIQPHFLFNTLNNLYSLTLAKSDLAPKVVLKLSELLDFILYQSHQETIPISKEIELLEGFIDLESLRYGDKVAINFQHTSENEYIQVSPLLLLPMIENAFKHGVSGRVKKAEIRINLQVTPEELNFEIYNSKPNTVVSKELIGNGIGNVNLKRQLELNYPNAHSLNMNDTPTSYQVNLTLQLNERSND